MTYSQITTASPTVPQHHTIVGRSITLDGRADHYGRFWCQLCWNRWLESRPPDMVVQLRHGVALDALRPLEEELQVRITYRGRGGRMFANVWQTGAVDRTAEAAARLRQL